MAAGRCHDVVTTRALHTANGIREQVRTRAGFDGLFPLANSKIGDVSEHPQRARANTGGRLSADLKSAKYRFEFDL